MNNLSGGITSKGKLNGSLAIGKIGGISECKKNVYVGESPEEYTEVWFDPSEEGIIDEVATKKFVEERTVKLETSLDNLESEINELKEGNINIDLTEYAKKSELHSHSNKSVLDNITSSKISEWDNKSTFNGDYNNLTNKPTIPTKTSQLTNDSGFITSIPSEYVTETELNNKGYLTQHQDISGKADITTLTSHTSNTIIHITEAERNAWNNMSNGGGSGGGGGSYILPKATSTTLGGIKLGSGLTSDDDGVVSAKCELDTSNYYSRTEVDYYINQLSNRITLLENSSGGNTLTVTYGEIVLSKSTSTITEGGTDTFTVKLDKSPTNNQVVILSKNNEDVNISPSSLTFTPTNYSTPQTVTITVSEDNTDYVNETCDITLSSPNVLTNVMTKTLTVNITDNDSEPIVPPPSANIPTYGLLLNLDTTNGSGDTVTETANNTKFTLTRFANDGVNSGWLDGGLKFNGSSDSLISDKNVNLKLTSGSFSYVIKTKIKANKVSTIFSAATGYFSLQTLSANSLKIAHLDLSGSWKNSEIKNVTLDGSKVYTIVIVFNGSALLVYIDGVLKNTFNHSTGFEMYNDDNVGYTIGANNVGWNYYSNITLYKFLKYNRALTTSEIEIISNI